MRCSQPVTGSLLVVKAVLLWAAGWLVILPPAGYAMQLQFERTYGGSGEDVGNAVRQTSDDGYIIVGTTHSFGAGGSDVYLIRTDPSGDTLWTRTYGGPLNDYGNAVQPLSDGGYIVAGTTRSLAAGSSAAYLIRTNASGDTLWTKTYGAALNAYGNSVQRTFDGGYVITGGYESVIGAYLVRTDSFGDTVWTRQVEGVGWANVGNSVCQTSDSGYVIAGTSWVGEDFAVGFLNKFDSSGALLWTASFPAGGEAVQETSDGGFVIAGPGGWRGQLGFLMRTTSAGDTVWTRTYTSGNAHSVEQTDDGGYITAGSIGFWSLDLFLVRTTSSGDTLWTRRFGGQSNDQGRSVRETTDGGFIAAGSTDSFGAGSSDIYLVQTQADGTVGVEVSASEEPPVFRLNPNYPNPFNPSTKISYIVNGRHPVVVKVYDLLGRDVRTLVDEVKEQGTYEVIFDGDGLASGVYIYRLVSGPFVGQRKMLLLR